MKDKKILTFVDEAMKLAPKFRKKMINPTTNTSLKLSPHEFYSLVSIYKDGPISMSSLAEKQGVSKQQLTRIINSLADNNLVERFINPLNRRIIQTKISNIGLNTLKEYQLAAKENMAQTLEILSEEEINECIMHMKALNIILSKINFSPIDQNKSEV